MQLTLRDVARLLGEPEDTVRRWIADRGLPAHSVAGQFQCDRSELQEWAADRGVALREDAAAATSPDEPPPDLVAALRSGGVHHRVPGADRRAALRSAVERLHPGKDIDREMLLAVLLARESLGSTGVGEGIAIPHVRNPIVLHLSPPAVTLCFLEAPVDFGAVDARPVHTLFLITSPTVRDHLHLLSRLSLALRDPGVRAALAARLDAESILDAFGRFAAKLPRPGERAPA